MSNPYHIPRKSDEIHPCPGCGQSQPAWNLAQFTNAAKRDKTTIEIVTGCMLSCQWCGEVYCVGPGGPFKRHANALPRLGPAPQQPQAPAEEPEGFVPPPSPRQRPAV